MQQYINYPHPIIKGARKDITAGAVQRYMNYPHPIINGARKGVTAGVVQQYMNKNTGYNPQDKTPSIINIHEQMYYVYGIYGFLAHN